MSIFSGFELLAGEPPKRVIVFLIDGLHWKAPDRLGLENYNSLIQEGTYVQKSFMITPHHPTVGEYGQLHTSSFPNPVLQSGTLFIGKEDRFLQEQFSPESPTSFVTNTTAYRSVSRGFTTTVQDSDLSDAEVVNAAMDLLRKQDQKYMRIHLQTAGNEGRYLSYTTKDKLYYRNIWGEGSPYVETIKAADALLGEFVSFLKAQNLWDSTLLVVSSDQGQAEIGWHPMIDEDSWITPLLFVGPGVAQNRTLPYFEHTDITPTICWLMDVEVPTSNGGTGLVIKDISNMEVKKKYEHPQYILRINRQINEYNSLRAKMMLAAERDPYFSSLITFLENELLTPEPFYHQDRFLEWYKAGTTEHLIEANQEVLNRMKEELQTINN